MGVLRLPRSGHDGTTAEDWYFSGVYAETGSLTTSVTGPSGTSSGSDTAGAAGTTAAGTTAADTMAIAMTLQTTTAARTTTSSSGMTTASTIAQYGR